MENIKIEIIKTELTVNLTVNLDSKILEIQGDLEKIKTGRCTDYEFSPSWFSSNESEEFYNRNWEAIEIKIQSQL